MWAAHQCCALIIFRSFSWLASSLPPVISAHLLWHEGFDKETLSESTVRSYYRVKCIHESSREEEHLAAFALKVSFVEKSFSLVFTSLFTRTPLRGQTSLSVFVALNICSVNDTVNPDRVKNAQQCVLNGVSSRSANCKSVCVVCSFWSRLKDAVQLNVTCYHWQY